MQSKILSFSNPQLKRLRALRDTKFRQSENQTIVEGLQEMKTAFKAGVDFLEVFLCEELLGEIEFDSMTTLAKASHVYTLPRKMYEEVSFGNRMDGVLGICHTKHYSLKDIILGKTPLILVLEHVEKPGNLGAVLRTCDAVGVDVLIVNDRVTDLYNPNVIRASLGTVFTIKTVICSQEETEAYFTKNKIGTYVATPDAKKVYTKADYLKPAAIIFGSEKEGVSPYWKKRAQDYILIPMKGTVDSLNVSVSAAVILYEVIRQRTK